MKALYLVLLLALFTTYTLSQDQCGCYNGSCNEDFGCNCQTGWAGDFCNVAICDTNGGCKNGACVAPNVCNCSTGWTGSQCDVVTCTEGYGVHGCNTTNGACISPDFCKCNDGYTGADCGTALCEPLCENGGVCVKPGQPCSCPKGWEGDLCEIPICRNATSGLTVCQHGSTCVGPQVCNCTLAPGWTGQYCSFDINECLTPNVTTCDKKTSCKNTVPGFYCTACPTGYSGTGETGCVANCPNGCSNGGICDTPNTCNCTGTGYEGSTCFTDVDECAAGGYCDPVVGCINTVGSFSCIGSCPSGYTGNPYMSRGGCKAICNTPCAEGYSCTSPDVCTANFAGQLTVPFMLILSILLLIHRP